MMPAWVIIALFSALFTSLRYIHIKNRCAGYSSESVIFVTRTVGAAVILPWGLGVGMTVGDPGTFALVTFMTVVVTAFALIIQVSLLQRHAISESVPFLSFVPVFMVPWSMGLLGELPGMWAFAGITLTCAGAYAVNLGEGQRLRDPFLLLVRNRASMLMLLVSFCLAFNTVCDKIAIRASSPLTYVVVWSLSSSVLMGIIVLVRGEWRESMAAFRDRHVLLQSLFWIAAYSCQMFAIRAAFGVASGTTYVKALQLLGIIGTVVLGGRMFRERHLVRTSLATLLMVAGAVVVVLSAQVPARP